MLRRCGHPRELACSSANPTIEPLPRYITFRRSRIFCAEEFKFFSVALLRKGRASLPHSVGNLVFLLVVNRSADPAAVGGLPTTGALRTAIQIADALSPP